ncbi:MAG: hypothetical protein ACK5Q5_05520 [Planctomycetaceae bacterium]
MPPSCHRRQSETRPSTIAVQDDSSQDFDFGGSRATVKRVGAWGTEPTANDAAADWLMHLFEALPLVEHVDDALQGDVREEIDQIRVAAHLLCMLGEAGLWPQESLQKQVSQATTQLRAALMHRVFTNANLIGAVRQEITRLERLLDGTLQQ